MPSQQYRAIILTFVDEYSDLKGYPPSVREIANRLQLSKTAAFYHVYWLEEHGYLSYQAKTARTFKVTNEGKEFVAKFQSSRV
jgi:SOS-response transcriptional repressor LexA